MSETVTKKPNALSEVTSLTATQQIIVADSSTGACNRVAPTNAATAILGMSRNLIYDNILIAYRENGGNLRMVHLEHWPALQNNGQYALAVVVNYGGTEPLFVAPTDASLYWSSANISGGGVTTTSARTALKDFAGEANTAAQIKHEECSGVDYAPGFCAAYSRLDSEGRGIVAGKWWLPSLGELNVIWSHINGINYALSLISGATQIPWTWHWSSTEYSGTHSWIQYFNSSTGNLYNNTKSTNKARVRPVTAYV